MPGEHREDRGDEQTLGREADAEEVPVDGPPEDAGDGRQLEALRLRRRPEPSGELAPAGGRRSERAPDPEGQEPDGEDEEVGQSYG